jgi:hypothetical protein
MKLKLNKKYLYLYLVIVILLSYFILRYIFRYNKTVEGFQPMETIFNFWMGLFKYWSDIINYAFVLWRWNLYWADRSLYGKYFSFVGQPENPTKDTNVPKWIKNLLPSPYVSS